MGTLLADLGAEDIKCDPPEGDIMRHVPFFLKSEDGTLRENLTHLSINRNKKCITLNLKTPEGQKLFRELVRTADVVVENFKPGTMEKWGLGYEELIQDPRTCEIEVRAQNRAFIDEVIRGWIKDKASRR